MNVSKRTEVIFLLSIFLLALFLRVGVGLYLQKDTIFPDAVYYDRMAENVAQGKGAVINEAWVANRMPLYPYVLGFFKIHITSHENYILSVRIFQSFLSALLVIPVYYITCMFTPALFALIAAFFIACNPLHNLMPSFLLTEAIYSFCLTMFIWSVLSFVKQKGVVFFLLSVAALLAGMYIKESMLHVVILLAFFSFFLKQLKEMRTYALTLFIIALCALSPWILRNYEKLGKFVPFTTNVGLTLYDSVNAKADGGTDISRFNDQMPEGYTELQRDDFWKQRAIEEIKKDPMRVISLAGRKFIKFWNVSPNADQFKDPRMIIAFRVYYIPLFVFFIIGSCVVLSRRQREHLIVSMPVIYALLLHLIIIGSLRYRMPLEPFVVIIAALGFYTTMKRLKKA